MRCPVVVGRQQELATSRNRLEAARSGKGGALFVSGEAGVGKSRLVVELIELARAASTIVVAGRAVPSRDELAYRPLTEVLAQLVRDRALPEDGELAPWRPALQLMLPMLGPDQAGGAEASPHVCGEALVRVLRWASDDRPVVVVLEDLHWADPDTLGVLEYLADNLATEPVLCVATLRDEPPTPALELARRIAQRGAATHLALRRLGDDQVAEMVAACVPDAAAPLLRRVQTTADGVPLLVEEVLATNGVPASVGEAVRTRVATLSDDDRAVLYAAAILGRDFDWELLPAVIGQPVEQVTAALERLVAAMLVSLDGDAGFRFRHALTRDAVLAMLIPPRRATLARAALAVLDEQRPGHGDADLALQAGDRQRASGMLTTAGRAALRRGALGTAIQTLQRAVDLVDDPTNPTDATDPADPAVALVEALALAGRLDEALYVGEQLLTQLGPDHPTAVTVHLELTRAAVAATRWPTATVHLEAARTLLAKRSDAALTAQADVLAAAVALADGDLNQARETAQRALTAATRTNTPHVACHALELIGQSHRVHDLAAARDTFRRAQQTAADAGLSVWEMRALHELGTIELLDHAGTDALEAARRTAEQLGALSTATVLDVQLAAAHHLDFDLAAARAYVRRAVAQSQHLGLGTVHAAALAIDACTCALEGDREAVTVASAQALRAAPGDPEIAGEVAAGATGLLELFWGDREAALAATDRGMAELHRIEHSAPAQYRGLWALLHAVRGGPDAQPLIEQVRRSGVTVMRPNRGYLHYAQAVLDQSAAEVDTGDAELRHAPVWQHLGRMLVAEAALAAGWGSPQAWLAEARGCFEVHRLDHLARHCTRLRGETPRKIPADVTVREAEVLQLVAEGLANKQIAARLQLSVRTVEKHVESLLRKTGATSRAQLIAMLGGTT